MGDIDNIDIGWRSALMFAVCLPMLVVALMLLLRRTERAANSFLAAFLFVAVIAQIPQIIGFSGFYTVWPGLSFAPFNVTLYAGPLLYLHADRLMMDRPLGWRRWLLLPGVMQTVYYTWAFTQLGDYRAKWDYDATIHTPYIQPAETFIGLGLMVFAIVAIFRMVRRYHAFLNDTQSAAADFEPLWLTRLVTAMVLAGLLFTVLEVAPLLVGGMSYINIYPFQVLLTAVVAWLGLQALAQTTVAFPKMPNDVVLVDDRKERGSADKDWVKEGNRLIAAVQDGAWHLESRLSIKDVAARMATNETYVSRALNKGIGKSFNSFINDLRVKHAQELLTQGELSLLNIAAAAGFNSKATFNRVFRGLSGQTPTQYRKSQKP